MKIVISLLIIAVLLGVTFWYTRKYAKKQLAEQQAMINQYKVTTSLFIIDKKMGKLSEAKFPKGVIEQMPKSYRWAYKFRKMPLVKAKVGNQILTLICEKKVFDKLPERKNVKVDIAGIYIVGIKGSK